MGKPRTPQKAAAPPPALGSVFAVPIDEATGWTACQIVAVGAETVVLLELRYLSQARPTLQDVRSAPPLRIDHHNWKGDLSWHHVTGQPPPEFVALGVLPVPELPPTCVSYGNWRGSTAQLSLQLRWDALPLEVRQAYKNAGPKDHWQVHCEGESIAWNDFDPMPRLTEIHYAGPDARVLSYVKKRALVTQLFWTAHGQQQIDLRGLGLLSATIDVTSPLSIHLDAELNTLRVLGDGSLVTCTHPTGGRTLEVQINASDVPGGIAHPGISGLPDLRELKILNARKVDAKELKPLTELRRLSLHGALVEVTHVATLASLKNLEELNAYHCYGLDAEDLPVAATAWPALVHVSIDGYRKRQTATWKTRFAAVRTLELRGAKSDEWLKENIDNPFRDWVDRSPPAAKKATAAWRTAVKKLEDKPSPADAEKVLLAFVETFNAIDKKMSIDTVDREAIGDAFFTLARHAGVTRQRGEALFDGARVF